MKMRGITWAAALLVALPLVACGDDNTNTPTGDTQLDLGGDLPQGDAPGEDVEEDTHTTPDVAEDTGTDTADVTPDEGPAPSDKLLCPEITQCVVGACGQNVTQACVGTALSPGGDCEPASQAEAGLWQGMLTCQNGCVVGNALDFDCIEANCLDEISGCNAGGTFGAGTCIGIVQCQQACGNSPTTACIRACYAGASAAANNQLQRVEMCIQAECGSVPQAQLQACIQTAIGGECSEDLTNCQLGIDPTPVDPDPEVDPDAGTTDTVDATEEVIEDTATEDTATEDTATEDTATEDTATEDTATGDEGPMPDAAEETPGFAPQFAPGARFYKYLPAY